MINKALFEITKNIKKELCEYLDSSINYDDKQLKIIIEKIVLKNSENIFLSINQKKYIKDVVFNSLRKFDIIQPLLDDDYITEIMINGPKNIYFEKNGKISKSNIEFENEDTLYNIIQTMVSSINRAVNESSPLSDARLKDGSRINVALAPVALNGPILTIRKFPKSPLTMKDLIASQAITEEAALYLKKMVLTKRNIFISGGTGTGKTTFLNILTSYIPIEERIITIEDSAELKIQGAQNIVRMEARNPNSEGKGEITIRDLIKTSLRMRPDRIIVGEVRGAEALDMLQAMNTGHSGSISTGHANSSKDMLTRLETMVLCGASIPLEAIRKQISSALDIIIHLGRIDTYDRKVIEISEICGVVNGEIVLNDIFSYDYEKNLLQSSEIILDQNER